MPNECVKCDICTISIAWKIVKELDTHPYLVNCGQCDMFADEFINELKSRGETAREGYSIRAHEEYGPKLPVHFWVEWKGLCFDAEEPRGTKYWWDLPIYARLRRVPAYRDTLRLLDLSVKGGD